MADEPKTAVVQITNTAPGARYVHGINGPVLIAKDETSDPFEISVAELADIAKAKHFEIEDAELPTTAAAAPAEEGATIPAAELPEDLQLATSKDGMISKADLIAKAAEAGAELESDDNKAFIATKIVAARAKAAAGQA